MTHYSDILTNIACVVLIVASLVVVSAGLTRSAYAEPCQYQDNLGDCLVLTAIPFRHVPLSDADPETADPEDLILPPPQANRN